MSYKTILVHVDESRRAGERIRVAANLAITQDAHLIGAAMTGISRFLFQGGALQENDPNLASHLTQLRQRANRAIAQFEPLVQKLGVNSFEKRVVDDEADGGISLAARYSDLVVISQNDPDEPSPTVMSDFPEYVVMNSGRPVLLVPYAGQFKTVGEQVLVAWDASMEATRAVTAAIQPGADIALFLVRHGVKVEVLQHRTDVDIGNALLSLTSDMGADLLVMGGYGHSRFREVLLGGATRTILNSMTVPVLMMH
jgi:nucleotide-binding universal stress UspA family protein